MGFLKNFFRNAPREGAESHATSCFEQLSEQELETHLRIAKYGDFTLSEAVRPSYNLEVVPRRGYRHDTYRDEKSKVSVPVLMAAASTENLFDLFMDLLDPLGSSVDVVLETSHTEKRRGHTDLYREQIDMPVLLSTLYDFEDMLVNDGCTGIAILNPAVPLEVQFDEHKLLIVYGSDLSRFEQVLADSLISRDDSIKFITEAEHVHSSSDTYYDEFQQLRTRLAMDSLYA